MIGGHDQDDEEETPDFKVELDTFDLFLLSLTFMACPTESLRFFASLSYSGSWVTVSFYLIGVITISMPVVAIQFFLAEYTRSSFLKVWDILPAFRGAGYITILTFMIDNSFRGGRVYAGIGMLLTTLNGKWKNCDFPYATSNCLPLNNTEIVTNCSERRLSPIAYYEVFYYYENNTNDYGLSLAFIMGQSMIWVCVCFLTNLNIKWLMDTFKYCLVVGFAMLSSIMCLGILYTFIVNFPTPSSYLYKSMSVRGLPAHILNMCFYSSYQERPGVFMHIASRSKLNFEANSMAMLIFFLKYIFLLFMSILMMVCIDILHTNIKIYDMSCLQYSGVEALMGIPPAVMYYLVLTDFFTTLWYLLYVFWQIPILIITLQSIVLSICQVHPIMPTNEEYKCIPSIIVCMISFVLTLIILRFKNTLTFRIYYHTVRYTTTFLILTMFLSALILYSVENLQTDYQFQYGGNPRTNWMLKIKIALVFHVACFFMIYLTLFKQRQDGDYHVDAEEFYIFIAVSILFHSPLVISFIVEYRRLKSFRAMFRPLRTFGPYSSKEKRERRKFIPAKFEKYRFKNISKLCRHVCLANSNSLQEEVEFDGYKIANFRKIFRSYQVEMRDNSKGELNHQETSENEYSRSHF